MWHTLTAKEGAQDVHAYAADMNERLINASIETETILTGRRWGTPAPEVQAACGRAGRDPQRLW